VQQSTPARRREARKNAGGRPPKIAPHQQQQLQEKYHSDMAAEPRLAKHDAAVLHVKALAKSEFGIEVGTNTLLEQIIRPALQKTRNNQ
jgi:transposase